MKRKTNEIGILIRWSAKLTVATILILIGFIVCSLYLKFPQYRDELKFITATIAGLAAIYSAYYIGANIRQKFENEKIGNSFKLIDIFNGSELIKNRTKIQQLVDSKSLPAADISETVKSDPDLQVAVKSTLNLFESTSIAIQHGYADEKILFEGLCVYLPWLVNNMAPYISDLSAIYDDERIFCESIKLAGSWTSGNCLFSGEPIAIAR